MSARLVPLGGLGEFGANSMLVEAGGESVLIDAGAAFTELDAFGISYEVPDFAALGAAAPAHALFTHGHDDHLRAAGSLLEAFPATKVWGSRATLARAEGLAAVGHDGFEELRAGVPNPVGPMTVEALAVSHSIPGSLVLRLSGEAGTLVVATDLRLATSALGEETSREALAGWGRDGVDVLMLDATNALVEREPPSEAAVGETLAALVRRARGAVFAVTFASHVGRFKQLALAARDSGRVVVPMGRGLVETLEVHAALGGLGLPTGLVRRARELPDLPRDRVLVVATGSQGEPAAAFSRLAADRLPGVAIEPGDLVIHAARVIPGSGRRLAHLFDHAVRRGARVVTAAEAPVHASGHAHRAELREMIGLLRPRTVLPVHGRRRNLQAIADLAAESGCRTLVVENGEEIEWLGDAVEVTGTRRGVGRILFDDVGEETVDPALLRHRRTMAQDGVLVAVLERSPHGDTVPGAVQLHAVGLDLGRDAVRMA
ncbi:MAG: MBL fold metallo-hydrolase RNA specificity domain-containing protein, partial [Acidobacteriota bacterium]